MEILDLFIITSAMWRVASLIANEMGPFHMLKNFRHYCGELCEDHLFWRRFHLYELVTCEWCLTVWMGVVATVMYYFLGKITVWLALPFALSAGAIVIKLSVHVLHELCSYLVALQEPMKRKEVKPNAVENNS